jgi:hypothetical protein
MFVRLYHRNENTPIPKSFESFIEAIGKWDGLYAELDGSFVWVWHENNQRYQLDGMVYDRGEFIEYIELKGTCSETAWLQLCSTLLSPAIPSVTEEPTTAKRSISDTISDILRVHDLDLARWISPLEPTLFT